MATLDPTIDARENAERQYRSRLGVLRQQLAAAGNRHDQFVTRACRDYHISPDVLVQLTDRAVDLMNQELGT